VPLDALLHRSRPSSGDPEGALVLLHGRGTDENDLYPLLDILDPERRLAGFTLRGPLNLPPGGWHWYRLAGIPTPDPVTFGSTYERVSEWLDSLPDLADVPLERTVIGGFSQGAVMSYALGLGADRPAPAGIVALSGFLPRVPGFQLDLDSRAELPVAIGHGTQDPVIGVEYGREARKLLSEGGLDVTWRESPMMHGVDPGYLAELAGWLREAVPSF
jgi:phospholipase/carboxylesterase